MVKAPYQQQCSRVCQERGIINQSTHYWKATALLWSKLDRVGLWRFSVGPESSWTAHTVLNSPRIPSGKRRKGIKPRQTRRESIPLALVEDSRTGGGQVSGLVKLGVRFLSNSTKKYTIFQNQKTMLLQLLSSILNTTALFIWLVWWIRLMGGEMEVYSVPGTPIHARTGDQSDQQHDW